MREEESGSLSSPQMTNHFNRKERNAYNGTRRRL